MKDVSSTKNKKIKILFIFNSCKNVGPTRVIINILKNLDKNRYEPLLLTFRDETASSCLSEFTPYIKRHYICKIGKTDIILGRLKKLKKIIKTISPDVIHTTGVFPDSAISKVASGKQVLICLLYTSDAADE